MKKQLLFALLLTITIVFNSCKNSDKKAPTKTPKGMVWIPGGTFLQGAVPQDKTAMMHEKPQHKVTVDGFFMDITEVTNSQFKKFIDATSYITVAERKVDWNELKKQLPVGTQKPHGSILQPGSLIFKKRSHLFLTYMIFHNGGNGKLVRIGNIQKGKTAI